MQQPRAQNRSYPVEDFLQALTAQLDRAQDALALKVSGTNRPLTWALKDLTIDLRVFIEVNDKGKVLIRSAGPNEEGASTLHLNLTTITRPMVEENSYAFHTDTDPRSIGDIKSGLDLDEGEQRTLDWMGVRTVGQLKQLDPQQVQAIMGIPAARLQAALAAASRPTVMGHEVVRRRDGTTLLKIQGANLTSGVMPEVKLAGDPVEVVDATPRELVVRPLACHEEGQIEVFTEGQRVTGYFRMGGANGASGAKALDHAGPLNGNGQQRGAP